MIEINSRNAKIWSRLGPSGALGAAAAELAHMNDDIAFLTADLCFFSGLERYKSEFPNRLYNFGIAEQNMLGVAGGMAKEGIIPFATTYASFAATRCADQVRVNMAYMKLPIKLIGLTAGFGAGILGATHMSVEDLAIMRAMPNITVISPADCTEIIKVMIAAATTKKPIYIRLTGPVNTPIVYKDDYDYQIGKAICLKEGEDVCVIATGSMVYQSLEAAEFLEKDGISTSVINMHTLKPLDVEAIDRAKKNHKLIVTVEEHSVIGGLGSAVAEQLAKSAAGNLLEIIGINDFFPVAGSYEYQLELSGLMAEQIGQRIKRRWEDMKKQIITDCRTYGGY